MRRFDIPAGTLDTVLAAFRRGSGVEVIVARPEIGFINSAGVSGEFTPALALRRILSGTGVSHHFTGPNTVTLDLRLRETVEVTAATRVASPKVTEPLRDVPQTITVVPQAVIGEQVATSLRDVLRNVTGISIQAGEGGVPAGDNLSIRGFSARTDLFIDGVRDFGGYSRDPFNVEQVEVAKGPSSSYGGRGSTGGSVNLVSKSPATTARRAGSFGAGSAAYKRGTVDVNQPLGTTAAARLNLMYTGADTPGRDRITNERWGVAPSLALGLGTATRFVASYSHLDQDNVPDYGLPWVPANTNPTLERFSEAVPPAAFDNFYGLVGRDYEKTKTDLGTGRVEHDLSEAVTLRALGRYGRTRRDSLITAPRFATVNTSTDVNRQLQSRDMFDTIAVGQLDAVTRFHTAGAAHAVALGVEYADEGSDNYLRSGPTAPVADLFNPDPDQPYSGPVVRTGAVNRGSARSLSGYAFDTVHLGPRIEVTGGLRWDRFDVDYDQQAVDGVVTPFRRTDEMVSGRAGIVFKPKPNASIYAGYGTSFNPSAEGLTLSVATVNLEPEKSRSFELGTKWDLAAGGVSLNTALFRTEKTNARTLGVNPGDPPTVLDGEQHVNGVELGVTGELSRRWSVFAGYTYMDGRVDRSNNPIEVGKPVGNTPKHSISLWTTVRLPGRFEVGGGAWYVGKRFNNNQGLRHAGGYWVLDATASREVTPQLTLRLKGSNLTNEHYIDRIGGGHFIPGASRSVFLAAELGL